MNSNRKSRERTTDDLRCVEPYKRSTKEKQAWQRGSHGTRQYTKLEDMA